MDRISIIDGGITAVQGFQSSGAAVGIKKGIMDMAIIYSEVPCYAAGVFTKNLVKAAPVQWSQSILSKEKKFRAIITNSGNANACTGELGKEHVKLEAEKLASLMNIEPNSIFVSSTGVIGKPLPIDIVLKGIETTAKLLGSTREHGELAAKGIMTTDTIPKEIAVEFTLSGKNVRIGAIAKGAGMINPNMATMLGFIVSDCDIAPGLLQKALSETTENSFNMISVDGDTSTNDQLTIMANGLAGNPRIEKEDADYILFKEALELVNKFLTKKIAYDGEGATKFLEVHVQGAKNNNDARTIVKSVVSSVLVKCAFFGEDANWGRILCAMGYSGAEFDPLGVTIKFNAGNKDVTLMEKGVPQEFDEVLAKEILGNREIRVEIYLFEGNAEATAWGCDLSHKYVDINGHYRS